MKLKCASFIVLLLSAVSSVPVHANQIAELMTLAGNGETIAVRALLDSSVDVNSKDNFGFTALMFAARNGHTTTVQLLLSRGADVNIRSTLLGYTALMNAVSSQKIIIVKELLDKGADVNARNDDGVTALTFAEELGDTIIVELLKRRGASN